MKKIIATLLFCLLMQTSVATARCRKMTIVDIEGVAINLIYPELLVAGSPLLLDFGDVWVARARIDEKIIPVLRLNGKSWCFTNIDVKRPNSAKRSLTVYQKKRYDSEELAKIFDSPSIFNELPQALIPPAVSFPQRPLAAPEEERNKEAAIMQEAWKKAQKEPFFSQPFRLPLKNVVITGAFGIKRIYPPEKDGAKATTEPHLGVDLRAKNESVLAVNDGKVLLAQCFSREGNTMAIDHGAGIISLYLHLSTIKTEVGRTVKRGEVIGISGSTGSQTAEHLHFGIKLNGVNVDPLQFIELTKVMFEEP